MRNLLRLTAAWLCLATVGQAAAPFTVSAQAEEWVGRSVTLAGRKVSCGNADIMIDRNLPSEGGAGETVLILNPFMLNKQPPQVRLFVFKHECGHIQVGDSELDADCYAVNQGVREGWLDRKGLAQVCDSFEGAPETDTHPSAKRRCAYLDQCYAKAKAEMTPIAPRPTPATRPGTAAAITASVMVPAAIPTLPVKKDAVMAPPKVLSAWRCTEPLEVAETGAIDPIGQVLSKDAEHSELCR
ncbi:hypothetical protein [Hyphomicrobium sulfonivorans]|uniref:Uncharacterized protein n=1 Tax=Hyphomicrobium sulfonivorans TaxID=121290 RepID=A0A109BIB6_HYPSL|nr:hypothetical protein [Hyphomicrobium sulfonivorans]KWT69196.1 hypothetical protein APY04_1627 [Hyphomicrobium sulfonivorans]MBI1649798.1 hypothetical protein [Hyphomicrobium sulfonivorans]NSL71712.1 hypothetical protein [Hyphomicrobium sulfonivorans]